MALEPFVQSNVYDLSGGLLPVPEDTGYNIVMPVYTPAGPLEKTKVASQKEFLDKFMTSTKLVPDDHISAQFAYSVLASNPVYVMRACPSTLLEGMTSEGNTWLFDQEYNIVPKYLKFDVDLSLKNEHRYELSTPNNFTISLENLSEDFDDIILQGNSYGILSLSNNSILSRTKLTANEYWGKFEESVKYGSYYSVRFQSEFGNENNQYVSLNGNSYERLPSLTANSNPELPNNTVVYSTSASIPWFGLNVLAQEHCLAQLSDVTIVMGQDSSHNTFKILDVSNLDGITTDTASSKTASLLADLPIKKGSIGILNNQNIVEGKYTSPTGNDNTTINNVLPGQIYLNMSATKYVEMPSENGLSKFADNIKDSDLSADKSFSYAVIENAAYYPAVGESGDAWFSETGAYLTAKLPSGEVKYYDLSTGSIYVIDTGWSDGPSANLPVGIKNVHQNLDEATIGQTVITITTSSDSAGTLTIGTVQYQYTFNSSKEQNVESTVDSDIPCVRISSRAAGGVTPVTEYVYYNTTETLNTKSSSVSRVYGTKNCSSSIEFFVSVLKEFTNCDGAYTFDGSSCITVTGSLTLFVPAYSTAKSNIEQVVVNKDSDDTPTYTYSIDATHNDELIKFDKLQIVVGDTTYYVGPKPPDTRTSPLSTEPCNEAEFKALLQRALSPEICIYKGSFVSPDSNLALRDGDDLDERCVMVISSNVITQNAQECFAIVPKFPCTTNLFRFDYTYDNSTKIVSLFFNYKSGVATEEWTMSFVPGVVDGYGIDQWYTRVKSDYFQVVHLNDEAAPLESLTGESFGGSISVPEYDDQYAIDAIKQITDYEDGIQYEIISDAGICSPNLATAIGSLTKDLWAVYPFSIPPYTKDKDVINYIGALGESCKQFECRAWAVADRMPVGTFSAVMPGSYKCINKMIEASRSGSMEFAPIGGLNHGTVGVVNLVQNWKKKAREELLDYRVCTVKGGVTTPYYINQNYTMQPTKSYMLEEQNVRMTNAAIHVIQTLAVNYLHELNTKRLRDKVQENVNKAIQDRLFKGKAYTPAQYMAVCDDTNNPISVIEQNKLVISLYASFTPSIHYILIDHYIVSLDQINSSEG